MEREYDCKTIVITQKKKDIKEVKVLNRIITWEHGGITYEVDPRHAEIMVSELGLSEANSFSTPSAKEEIRMMDADENLGDFAASRFRSLTVTANYLAHGRPDIQFACKDLSAKMSEPNEKVWERLERLGRCRKGTPRIVHVMQQQRHAESLTVFSVANCAGDKENRKSTSGCAMKRGGHTPKTWSKAQTTVALSSAASELYGLVNEHKGRCRKITDRSIDGPEQVVGREKCTWGRRRSLWMYGSYGGYLFGF